MNKAFLVYQALGKTLYNFFITLFAITVSKLTRANSDQITFPRQTILPDLIFPNTSGKGVNGLFNFGFIYYSSTHKKHMEYSMGHP